VNGEAFIRQAGLDDLECLARLHGASFEAAWTADAFARLLATPGAFALVAEAGGAPRAFLLARAAGGECEFLTLGTEISWRRRGLARALAARAMRDARARGARMIFLEVGAGNLPARHFYAGLGFREVGQRPRYYGNSEDALVLRADLPLGDDTGLD